jgi:Predicted DNA alkylation repair enzyme
MYSELEQSLYAAADPSSKAFSERIISTAYPILGVRSPAMRAIIKEVLRSKFGEPLDLLAEIPDASYESLLVQSAIIAEAKNITTNKRQELISAFVPKIDNWATCDSFIAMLKCIKKSPAAYFGFLKGFIGQGEFSTRFAVVSMMSYYLIDDYIDDVLDITRRINCADYYVMMAVAWCFATALAKYYNKTFPYIEAQTLDKKTHNKAIQKAVESFRITPEQKEYLRSLKIK